MAPVTGSFLFFDHVIPGRNTRVSTGELHPSLQYFLLRFEIWSTRIVWQLNGNRKRRKGDVGGAEGQIPPWLIWSRN